METNAQTFFVPHMFVLTNYIHVKATAVVKKFVSGTASAQPVLILSYEMYRKFSKPLSSLRDGFLMCDEGACSEPYGCCIRVTDSH